MKTRPVTINVTPVDIRDGRPLRCCACPVARAIQRRLLPRFTVFACHSKVSVVATSSVIRRIPTYKPNARKFAALPPPASVAAFMQDFDLRRPVKPFRFTLHLPVSILK